MMRIAKLVPLLLAVLPAIASAATVNVAVGPGLSFFPPSVTVAPGDTVQWNFSGFHTTTSDTNTGAEVWDSGLRSSGSFSHTFTNVGDWPYYCTLHSVPAFLGGTAMNGVVHVVASTPAPALTSVLPASGRSAGGTPVTLTGSNFDPSCTVAFGGVAATGVSATTSSTIAATTPAHAAGPVNVTVTCTGGSATLTNGFTYLPAPTLTAVNPPNGPAGGGTGVTLTGTGFDASCTVAFGGSAATGVSATTAATIAATTPAHAAGAVNVTVTCTGGSATLTNGFTYLAPPTLTSVNPPNGPTGGGTGVTLTGTSFDASCTASFGGAAATGIASPNSTTITATTPSHAAGAVNVTVTCTGGSATLTNGFTYLAAPTLTSVNPPNGPTGGGTGVTLTGTNFSAACTVDFGGAAATGIASPNSTTITATTPPHAAGAVNVTVTCTGGSAPLTNGFTYLAAPTLTSINPPSGPAGGGTGVTLTGTNFAAGCTVDFGGAAATGVAAPTSTTITATTPPHAVGPVNVTVTCGGGSAALTNGFTFDAAPTLSSVNPPNGPTGGGTGVTLTGTSLDAACTVDFGGAAATGIASPTSTTITATTPPHAAGAVNVTVTCTGGSATLANGFTYLAAPTLASVSPVSGPAAGGTAVTLTGTNFAASCAVDFGGAAATGIASPTSTTITATTPPHAAGPVNVTVTCGGGSATLTSGFTFIPAPAITSVSPPAALPGATITINGTGFQSGATVTIGGVSSPTVTFGGATTLTAVVPSIATGPATIVVTNPDKSSGSFVGFAVTSLAVPMLSIQMLALLAAALALVAIVMMKAQR